MIHLFFKKFHQANENIDQSLDVQSKNDLEEIKKLVSKLYLHLNIEYYEKNREQEIVKELELLKTELEPMEQVNKKIDSLSNIH
jgi:hypothetical protein